MNETALLERYREDKPLYMAWGRFVRDKIVAGLKNDLAEEAVHFLRIPPEPRLKDDDSLAIKAFYRNKQYDDPYLQITDKVGVRFVVLLSRDIGVIDKVVESEAAWTYAKDRDFELERNRAPLIFDYQSNHYIVRAKTGISFDGVAIPEHTPCEIQIRTLLQHAYCEVTHEAIHKPEVKPETEIYRLVARSMALVESTDEMLGRVSQTMQAASKEFVEAKQALSKYYKEFFGFAPENARYNDWILNIYADELLAAHKDADVSQFISSHLYLREQILPMMPSDRLFRQSASLLLLVEIERNRHFVEEKWPFEGKKLDGLFLLLGISRG